LISDEFLADLVLLNGDIITLDAENSITQSLAVKNGRILKVGNNEDIKSFIGKKTKVINLEGLTVLPGFIDTHVHMTRGGTMRKHAVQVWSPPLKSVSDILNAIKEKAEKIPKGQWIQGQG
jgi:predicted amidohydrolase YtcJ